MDSPLSPPSSPVVAKRKRDYSYIENYDDSYSFIPGRMTPNDDELDNCNFFSRMDMLQELILSQHMLLKTTIDQCKLTLAMFSADTKGTLHKFTRADTIYQRVEKQKNFLNDTLHKIEDQNKTVNRFHNQLNQSRPEKRARK